jgi:ornithine decarboxylase
VRIARLNVGGGFPSHRLDQVAPDLAAIFDRIDRVTAETFGADRPTLVCEPGRGMVGDSFSLVAGVKAVRDGQHVFLTDGIYGTLAEMPLIGMIDRSLVLTPEGTRRDGAPRPAIVFGPTCDSVDRLPGELPLPGDVAEGDYVVVNGMGAYSTVTNTRFNGFGELTFATVLSLRA